VARIGDRRSACKVFLERPEEQRPLGKGKRRLEDDTKMYLSEVRRGVDWINLL
jgi:hypothetical protein